MYSNIIETFLKSIHALRFYVDSVEPLANKHSIEVSDNPVATIMWVVKLCKELGQDPDSIVMECFETAPDEMKESIKKMLALINESIREKEVDGKVNYYFPGFPKKVTDQLEKMELQEKQKSILYSGSLMLLITYFENLISKIFKKDFIDHPQKISLDSKSVPYKILEESGSIEEVKEHLIDIEVNSMMYKSLSDWIDYLKKNRKLELSFISENLKILKEIMARRNLFVHNDGIINQIYLSITKDETGSKYVKGDTININKEYINNAIGLIELSGTSLVFEIWLKECKGKEEEVDKILSIIFNEYLVEEKWECAINLYKICLDSQKLNLSCQLTCKINYWQCFKWLNRFNEIKNEIDKTDLSAAEPKYKLGVLALKDEVDKFFEVYDNQSDIGKTQLYYWPIFKSIRESDIYMSRFNKEDESNEIVVEVTEKDEKNNDKNEV